MPRARWVKPEFFTDKKIGQLGPVVALVYQALWVVSDDHGVAPCEEELLKGQVFFRWSAVGVPEITEALRDLERVGRIERYVVGDEVYAKIVRWDKHQKVHKPSMFRNPVEGQPLNGNGAEIPGTGVEELPESPPPRHLDTYTPRHLEETKGLPVLASPGKHPVPHDELPTAVGEWLSGVLSKEQQLDGAMRLVFSYWVARTNRDPKRTILVTERKAHLRARLREQPGKELTEVVSPMLWAIDGLMSSSWHVENKQTKLAQIFRNRSRLEEFAERMKQYQDGQVHPLLTGGQ